MKAREIVAKLRKGEVYSIEKRLFDEFKKEIVRHNLMDITKNALERLYILQANNERYVIAISKFKLKQELVNGN